MADAETNPSPHARAWWHRKRLLLPLLAVGLLFSVYAGLNWLDSAGGQRWLTGKLSEQVFKSGLSIHIKKVDGSLLDQATLHDVTLHDLKGPFLIIHDAKIDWTPGKILRKHIIIDHLNIGAAQWLRRPVLNPGDPNEPLLPDWDIDIHDLDIRQLNVAPAVAGDAFALKGKGTLRIAERAIRTDLSLDAIGTPDHAQVHLIAAPASNEFDIKTNITAERGGGNLALRCALRAKAITKYGKAA
jgi:translocation and assembly module TamB